MTTPLFQIHEQVCTFDFPRRVGYIRNMQRTFDGVLIKVEVDWGLGSNAVFYGIEDRTPPGERPISDLRRATPLDRSPTSVERWLADG